MADNTLDIFDPRTGLAEKIANLLNSALKAYRDGDKERSEELMRLLEQLKK